MEKRMTFEQILNDGYVVAADDWMNVIIVWNGSGTFNVWSHVEDNAYRRTNTFMKFDIENAYQAKLHSTHPSPPHHNVHHSPLTGPHSYTQPCQLPGYLHSPGY